MSEAVLIAVTHLLGVGHLARAAALARGFADAGHRVTLVSGGRPAPLVGTGGIDLVQLPPVQCAGTDFRTLLDADGRPVGEAMLAERSAMLVETLGRVRPAVVVTETFPFGRRQLAAEFIALLEAASAQAPRPAILASVRDILNPPSRASKAADADAVLARFFDGVLVHGEQDVTPLDASWPVSAGLRPHLHHTGYVADAAGSAAAVRTGEVLVSGGGSAASLPLFAAALGAARLLPHRRWRLLVGHGVGAGPFAALLDAAPANAVVERARPDFPALLAGAAVSVSQAGYNTMIDLARAGVAAIVVPFEDGNEAEQRLRAERFAAAGRVTHLPAAACTPDALAEAVERAGAEPKARVPPLAAAGIAGSLAALAAVRGRMSAEDAAWARLDDALDAAGGEVPFWWRDDDAVAPGAALDRLLDLARTCDAPLSLAVIPALARLQLADRLRGEASVHVLVHGLAHVNHAPPEGKKQEFGWRPVDRLAADAARGLALVGELFGARALPVFVPPWNRVDAQLVPRLAGLGFRGISAFGARQAPFASAGLLAVNTHLDPIDWRGNRSLAPPARLLTAIAGLIEARAGQSAAEREPIGILTHHLVHDEWVWRFLDRLMQRLKTHPNARLLPAGTVFALSCEAAFRAMNSRIAESRARAETYPHSRR